MARFSDEEDSIQPIKLLMMGASGSGKTSSLLSLIEAGYDVRVLDLDKGINPLKGFILQECPDKKHLLDVESVSDELRGNSMGIEIQKAKAFPTAMKRLTKWTDDSVPAEWGLDTVCVIDSLSRLGDYAYSLEKKNNPVVKDRRQWYFSAQQLLRQFLDMITADSFHTNVIVMAHINIQDTPEGEKQLPKSIGQAFNTDIPTFFNNMVVARKIGAKKRVITLHPSNNVDLKNEKPFKFDEPEIPLRTGLAEIFEKLRAA